VWKDEQNIEKIVAQMPKIKNISICAFTMKFSNNDRDSLSKKLNQKANRTPLNKILVAIKG
jgi:hypothetical protein